MQGRQQDLGISLSTTPIHFDTPPGQEFPSVRSAQKELPPRISKLSGERQKGQLPLRAPALEARAPLETPRFPGVP